MYAQTKDHDKAVRSEKNIVNSIKLLKLLNFENEEKNKSVIFQFAIGLLEVLEISAFITDESGNINGYNPNITKLIHEKKLTGSYLNLLNEMKNASFTLKRCYLC